MTVPFLSPCFQKVDFPGVNQLQFPLQLILSTDIIFLYSDPAFQVLKDEPRFRALVAKLEALPKPEQTREEKKI